MATLPLESLLAEIEDILRTQPEKATIRHDLDENHAWLGRVSAAVARWNAARGMAIDQAIRTLHGRDGNSASEAFLFIRTTLNAARHDLRLTTVGPLSVALDAGGVFDYFDEVRKVIEAATSDLLFVDPYLDAEFVSRYLPHVPAGVPVRLLASARMATLLPAVQQYVAQTGLSLQVRSTQGMHDRYVFVDRTACYQSGASFKDGAKKAPTTLTQITDAFAAVQQTYEVLWAAGTVHM